MARTPIEEGAYRAGRAIEAVRRHGLTRDQVLEYYLSGEGCGIQGALNAAVNTYGEGASYAAKEQFVIGWVTALLRLKLQADVAMPMLAPGREAPHARML